MTVWAMSLPIGWSRCWITRCSWHTGPQGMPILDDAAAWFVGKTLRRIDLGDHIGYLLEPVTGAVVEHSADLVGIADVADLEPGHKV